MYFPERPNLEAIPISELSLPEWVRRFSKLLELSFLDERNKLVLLAENEVELEALNDATRTTSEMGVCSGLERFKTLPILPPNVEVVHGSVFVDGLTTDNINETNKPDDFLAQSHWFLRIRRDNNEDNDLIACFTAGQFIAVHKTRMPGERLAFLSDSATKVGLPGLVHAISPQLSLIYGTRDQLRSLGLNYIDYTQQTRRPTGGIKAL